jgi:hypothetical protein
MNRFRVRACVAVSLSVGACVPSAVPLEIDASAVDVDGATITVVVYADDGGGCDALQFVAVPSLPVLLSAVAPFAALDVPRAGAKLIVVEATVDDVSVARGCTAVGSDADARRVVLAPTLHLVDVDATTLVVADLPRGASATVVDATGAVVANAAVSARVLDSQGVAGDTFTLTSDAEGRIDVAPTSAPAGPVRVELVVERPRSAVPTRLAGFAPPAVLAIAADVALRPFATTTGAAFAGVDATGVVVVDVVNAAAAPARTVLASPTARLAGLVDGATRQWLVVDVGTPLLVSDVDSVVVAAAAPAVVDDAAPLQFIAAGDCTVAALPGIVSSASEQALLTLVDGVLTATALPPERRVVSSACVLDDAGARHRVLVLAGAAMSAVDVGDGLASPEALTSASAITAGLERSLALAAQHDGALLSIEPDGAEVILRTLQLAGAAFVDVSTQKPRLPSAPLLVAHGAFGGDDVFALLDGAFFGVGTSVDGAPIAAGFATTLCSSSLCGEGTVADVDNDGRVEVLVPQNTGGAIVRLR